MQPLHRVDRGRQRHLLLAAGECGLAPRQIGEGRREVRPEPVDLEREVHVLQDLFGERPELGALPRRHRREQPGHRRHPSRHLSEQLIERPRVAGEELAVALHEPVEVVRLAPLPLLDHAVQLGQHVAEPSQVLGRHRAQPLRHAAEVRAHDLLAQVLHQLVERLLGLGVDEPVVGQLPYPARDVGRERVQERLAHPGVVIGAERERRSLAVDDVVEPFAQLLERPGQVEVLLLAGAALAEPGSQGIEPVEAPLHPATQQPRQRTLSAEPRQHVVGDLLEQLAGREVRAEGVLRVIPARVASLHPTSLRRRPRNGDRHPMPRPVVSARSDRPKQMNDARANGTHGLVRNGSSRARRWAIARNTSGPNP